MHPTKAPGPDGLQPIFFQKCWNTVGVTQMVENALRTGMIDPRINESYITLIPKDKNPIHISKFRPISLSNVILKVITKTLANRLRNMMKDLIPQTQSSFIRGRQTIDNTIITQEIIHDMHITKKKNGSFLSKMDSL